MLLSSGPSISAITESLTESRDWPTKTEPIVKHKIFWNIVGRSNLTENSVFKGNEECFCVGRTFPGGR